MRYKIWHKKENKFVDCIEMSDGEILNLALTPDGRIIQYGNYTDYQVGEIQNPEDYEIIQDLTNLSSLPEIERKEFERVDVNTWADVTKVFQAWGL